MFSVNSPSPRGPYGPSAPTQPFDQSNARPVLKAWLRKLSQAISPAKRSAGLTLAEGQRPLRSFATQRPRRSLGAWIAEQSNVGGSYPPNPPLESTIVEERSDETTSRRRGVEERSDETSEGRRPDEASLRSKTRRAKRGGSSPPSSTCSGRLRRSR